MANLDKSIKQLDELENKLNTLKSELDALHQASTGFENIFERLDKTHEIERVNNTIKELRDNIENIVSRDIRLNIAVDSSTVEGLNNRGFDTDGLTVATNTTQERVSSVLNTVKKLSDGVNSAVNGIIKAIRTGISVIGTITGTVVNVIKSIASVVTHIIQLFGNLGNRVKEAFSEGDSSGNKFNGTLGIIKGSATELRSTILLLKGAFDKLFNNQAIEKAENLFASVYSLKNIAGKQVTQDVIDWANSMEYAFGLSARDLIGDINELTGVLYGLGMSAQDTAIGSENILIMSRYLAFMGAAGGKTDVVMQKLVSGMKGMTASVDDLGLSVRKAQMNQFLKDLKAQGGEFANIETNFSNLNEQARVYVRYAALIKQFTENYDITTFVDAMDTVTGRVNIFKQTVSSLVTTFGQGMYNIFSVLAGYLTPIIKYIETLVTKMFSWIYKFLGIEKDLNISTDMNDNSDSVDKVKDSVEDVNDELEETEKKSKKASGGLQSWDRINNITSKSDSDKDDSASKAFDYSKLMTSMLDKLNQMAADAEQGYFDKMTDKLKEKIDELREKLLNFAKEITGRADFDLGFDWDAIKKNLKNVLQNIGKLIKDWGLFVIEISLKILDDVNIGLIITKLTELLSVISDVAVQVTDVLIPAFRAFYDNGLSPIVKYIGEQVVKAIDFMIEELKKWGQWFTDNKDLIITFFGNLGLVVNQVFEALRPIFDLAWEWLGNKISGLGERLREILGLKMETFNDNIDKTLDRIRQWGEELPAKLDNIIRKVNEIIDVITGRPMSLDTLIDLNSDPGSDLWLNFIQILNSVKSIAESLGIVLKDLLSDLGAFTKEELIPWINEKLKELSGWLSEHKDQVVELLEKIASFAWEGFKQFVDIVGMLINFVVEHPNAVIAFFEGLLVLKVASWFTGVAASIGGLIFKIGALQKLGSIASILGGEAATGGIGALGSAIGALAGPIAIVVAAVTALAGVMVTLWNTSESFRETISKFAEQIGNAFGRLKDIFTGVNESTGESEGILSRLKDAWVSFSKALEPIITVLVEVLTPIIATLIDHIGIVVELVGTALVDVINILTGAINVITGILQAFIGFFVGVFTGDWTMATEGLGKVWEGLKQIIGSVIDFLLELFKGFIKQFTVIVSNIIDAVIGFGGDTVAGFGQGLKDGWDSLLKWVSDLWNQLVTNIKEFFGIHSPSTLFAEIGGFLVDGLLNGITEGWTALTESVLKLASDLWQGIQDVFAGVSEWFSEKFTSAKEAATEAWNDAKELFTRIKDNVINGFNDLRQNMSDKFKQAKESAVSNFDNIQSVFEGIANKAANGLSVLKSKASSIFSDIKSSADGILGQIGNKLSSLKSSIADAWNNLTGKSSGGGSAQNVTSHAVGGSIAGGQLFIANEHGEAELIGNIDGSQKTNVANNNMIIEAMRTAVFEAVYNAMAEVKNQDRGLNGSNGNVNIKLDGFGLIDSSTLRELARILAPYLNSNSTNIADIGFSI